jgi:hypothetical protein
MCAFIYQIRITHAAERAWIGVKEISPPNELEWFEFPAALESLPFTYHLKNRGRTPARILEVRVRFHMTDTLEGLPINPEYGDGGNTAFQHIASDGLIIAPDSEFTVIAIFEGQQA